MSNGAVEVGRLRVVVLEEVMVVLEEVMVVLEERMIVLKEEMGVIFVEGVLVAEGVKGMGDGPSSSRNF